MQEFYSGDLMKSSVSTLSNDADRSIVINVIQLEVEFFHLTT